MHRIGFKIHRIFLPGQYVHFNSLAHIEFLRSNGLQKKDQGIKALHSGVGIACRVIKYLQAFTMNMCKFKQKKEIRHVQKYNSGFCSYFNIEYKGEKISAIYISDVYRLPHINIMKYIVINLFCEVLKSICEHKPSKVIICNPFKPRIDILLYSFA